MYFFLYSGALYSLEYMWSHSAGLVAAFERMRDSRKSSHLPLVVLFELAQNENEKPITAKVTMLRVERRGAAATVSAPDSAARYSFFVLFLGFFFVILFSFIILLEINPPSHNPPGSSGWRSRRCLPTRCSSIVPKMCFVHVQGRITVLLLGLSAIMLSLYPASRPHFTGSQ